MYRVGSACTVYQASGRSQRAYPNPNPKPTLTLTLTRYKLSLPTRYDGNVSWPLLVGFHGWGGSGNHSLDAFHAHGKAAGYIVASPDGFAEDVGLGS